MGRSRDLADGTLSELNVDSNTLYVDSTNNRVGIGTASPAVTFDVSGYARTSTGILFGTDTAAANALDDYEEGTWTPTIVGGNSAGTTTYTNQTGVYTKIGRSVTCQFDINFSSMTGVGNVLLGGFPFAGNSTAEDIGSCMLSNWTFPSGRTYGVIYINPNSTSGTIWTSGSGVDWAVMQAQNISGGIRATITYQTA